MFSQTPYFCVSRNVTCHNKHQGYVLNKILICCSKSPVNNLNSFQHVIKPFHVSKTMQIDFEPSPKCPPKSTICFVSFRRLIAIIFALITGLSIVLLCKFYIKFILLWLETQDPLVISSTLSVLFILVSLPISIGYIVLVVAEGYLFGFTRGLILTVLGANLGIFIAHNILKLVGHHKTVYKYTQNDTAQAIMRLISGPLCFKIVLCSRLTPIPFGLQNTIFAVI